MSFFINEIILCGNATARVKNYYPANNFLVIMDISGNIESGMTVVGQCSGASKVLEGFEISDFADLNYDDLEWEGDFGNMLTADGEILVLEQENNIQTCDEDVQNLNLNNGIYLDTES